MDPDQDWRQLSIFFARTVKDLARHLDIQEQTVLHATWEDRRHIAVGDIGDNTGLQVVVGVLRGAQLPGGCPLCTSNLLRVGLNGRPVGLGWHGNLPPEVTHRRSGISDVGEAVIAVRALLFDIISISGTKQKRSQEGCKDLHCWIQSLDKSRSPDPPQAVDSQCSRRLLQPTSSRPASIVQGRPSLYQ